MKIIRESGVDFGPYEESDLFYIEESELKESRGEGVKTVEFILRARHTEKRTEKRVFFVEAKTNAANPENRGTSKEKQEKFEEFYSAVRDKFVDSLGIYTAALLKRYDDTSEIGNGLAFSDLKNVKLTFVLVITNPKAQIEWLPPIRAELEKRLLQWRKIWNVEVAVLNQDMAKQYELIQETTE